MLAVKKKLKEIDPSFKLPEDFNNYTPEEERAAQDDVMAFLDEMNEADKKIKGDTGPNSRSKAIFDDGRNAAPEQTEAQKEFIASLENKRSAEDARYRGNEYMKSKEYDEAIEQYTRSIDLNPGEPATYCNRAMAYLRAKKYARCIEDADKTIELEPDYVKAYHRRGKAYLATNKFSHAIKDFQYILEKNPEDEDINASLRQARQKLQAHEEKLEKSKPKTEELASDSTEASPDKKDAPSAGAAKATTKQFKRVNIVEDDESEEEEAAAT